MKRLLLLPLLLLGLLWFARADEVGQRFRGFDRDGDGRIAGTEMQGAPFLPRLDLDGDGALTLAEARKAVIQLRAGRGATGGTATPTAAATEWQEAPQPLKASECGVGRIVTDLPLTDRAGSTRPLSGHLAGRRGLIVALFGATCPISNKLGPELARLEKDAASRQVALVLLCPVSAESAEEIGRFVQTHGLQSPVVHDPALARELAATTTTEVFLIDPARTLVYRGAINDQHGLGYAKARPTRTYLRDALAALLRGEAPSVAATTAPGCALDLPRPAAVATPLTYHRDIARIVQTHCVECHRDGGGGPFSLERHEDVVEHAAMIRKQVERGAMPPWFAAPAEDGHSRWLNDRSLPARDKADLLTWLNGDRALGDPTEAPQPRRFAAGWTLGEPDAVVQLPRPVAVPAEGTMPYQFVTVPTGFAEDRWVQGYEIAPTDRSVVHHVIVQVHARGAQVRDRGEGLEGYWAAYVPGNAAHLWPEGFAKKLPAGATVSFQIHYTPNGQATQDQLKLGLRFAPSPPRYVVHTAAVAQPRLDIPPGAAGHVEVKEQTVPADMNLLACMAHMHVRGKAFKFEVTPPGGPTEILLDIPRYDFNWQLRYDCARPKFLARGSKVRITAVFDNSEANPANPDPARRVRWGQQTEDEMMIGYFEHFTPNPDLAAH